MRFGQGVSSATTPYGKPDARCDVRRRWGGESAVRALDARGLLGTWQGLVLGDDAEVTADLLPAA